MEFRYTYTRLNVADFEDCKAFYRDVIGLEVAFEDDKSEYVEFATGSTRLTLLNRNRLTDFVGRKEELTYDEHAAAIAITFQVTSIDAAITYLKNHGVEMIAPPSQHPDLGFITACFRDPAGNLIELEQMTDVVIG